MAYVFIFLAICSAVGFAASALVLRDGYRMAYAAALCALWIAAALWWSGSIG